LTDRDDIIGRLAGVFKSEDGFLIATHQNPDGDGLGSMLGLAHVLADLGKRVACYCQDPVPEYLDFLPGREMVLDEIDADAGWRVLVALDCGEPDRLGEAKSLIDAARVVVNIDHHVSGKPFGDLSLVDVAVSSTAELLMELFDEMGAALSHEAAVNLYTAIMTDTGSFKFDNVSGNTFKAAARLVDAGADPWEIYTSYYHNYSLGRLRLLALVLSTFRPEFEGKVGCLRADRGMFESTGTNRADLEGFVDLPRLVKGLEVSMLISPKGEGLFGVSLRSNGRVDVSAIAARHGGGGHRSAAAFKTDENPDTVERDVLDDIGRALKEL
jgi:phosphoesterase RecJ-like protein